MRSQDAKPDTISDTLRLPEGKRVELIDGELSLAC